MPIKADSKLFDAMAASLGHRTGGPIMFTNGQLRHAMAACSIMKHGWQQKVVQLVMPVAASTVKRRSVRPRVLSSPERGHVQTVAQSATQRNVVVAVDASEHSIGAYQWVLKNLLKPDDALHLLHVVPDVFTSPASGSIYYCSSPDPETERMLWHQAKQFFEDNFLEHARAAGLEGQVTLHLVKESRHKHIGKAVCKKAEELQAEPLVVATHDKGPLETLLLGSVSKFCVSNSKRPVLVLHPLHSDI